MFRRFCTSVLVGGVVCHSPVLAQVVPDGSTSTTVNLNTDGSVTVGIAPAGTDGISLNNYDQFNVQRPGVNLDNRAEGARTIVNEVTGTSRSEINGPVEVLGQTAHVIIANPNGISVDGGAFINTGRTVLTTGDISLNAREIAPGIFQENVVSTTTGGVIEIKGGGLSGQMDAIDLIAHQVRVDGVIANTADNPQAGVNIVAGASITEFDSSVVPGNLDQTWESVTNGGATSEGAVLVEITAPGAVRANRIEIQVTDQGAGARIAGIGQATRREFILRADGQIDTSGAQIAAATDVTITGGGVKLDSANIRADNGRLSVTADAPNLGGISGVDVMLSADEMLLTSSADVSFSSETLGGSGFITDVGNLVVSAEGQFNDVNGQWESAQSLSIGATSGIDLSFSTMDAAQSLLFESEGSFDAENTIATAQGNVLISVDDAAFSGVERRTEVIARNGSFILTTLGVNSEGNLINQGALLQGGQQIEDLNNQAETNAEGAVTLDIAGDMLNLTEGDNLAVVFGEAGDVVLRTEGSVENNAGRYVANGDVKIIAAGDVLNLIDLPNGNTDPEVTQYSRKGKRKWWTLWLKRRKRTYTEYDFGTVQNPDQLATITGTGSVTIESDNRILNQGGQINANGGDVNLSAVTVETVGVGSGRAVVERVCVVFCKYEGEDSIQVFGGEINAARDVNITATEQLYNKGGQIVAINDVSITTPKAIFEAILLPTVVERPGGLYNFWKSDAAWLYLRDRFGGVIASTGNITLDTDDTVELLGATLDAGGDVVADRGINVVREPRIISPATDQEIGIFRHVPPVSFD